MTSPADKKRAADDRPLQREVTVVNALGMHARPSAMFVRKAAAYQADIEVEKDGERVNGKSIMGLMMLAAGQGSCLKIVAQGPDAPEALDALEALVASGLGED